MSSIYCRAQIWANPELLSLLWIFHQGTEMIPYGENPADMHVTKMILPCWQWNLWKFQSMGWLHIPHLASNIVFDCQREWDALSIGLHGITRLQTNQRMKILTFLLYSYCITLTKFRFDPLNGKNITYCFSPESILFKIGILLQKLFFILFKAPQHGRGPNHKNIGA